MFIDMFRNLLKIDVFEKARKMVLSSMNECFFPIQFEKVKINDD